MFQLHVKDYQLVYGRCQDSDTKPFLKQSVGSVCFVNCYLMLKRQFTELVMHLTKSDKVSLPDKVAYGANLRL